MGSRLLWGWLRTRAMPEEWLKVSGASGIEYFEELFEAS